MPTPVDVSDVRSFSDALIRIRRKTDPHSAQTRAFPITRKTVSLKQQTLFRIMIKMPAEPTKGEYKTQIFQTRA